MVVVLNEGLLGRIYDECGSMGDGGVEVLSRLFEFDSPRYFQVEEVYAVLNTV